jgi:hypothetical protein
VPNCKTGFNDGGMGRCEAVLRDPAHCGFSCGFQVSHLQVLAFCGFF